MAVVPKRPLHVPHTRPTKIKLETGGSSEGGGGLWPIVLILLLVIGGAVGAYIWFHGLKKEPPPEIEEPPPPKPIEKPVEPKPVMPTEPEPPPPPKVKTVAELKAEADAAQKELDAKIAEARKQSVGKELPGFAGAKFGVVVKGVQIATEKLPGGGLTESGYGISMRGPELKTPFRSFGRSPTVWVTPKTHKVYKIEFARDLDRTPGPLPDPDTTNLVAVLSKKLRRDPFALDPEKYPMGRREYVFPFGTTTLTVSEPGGGVQKLTVVDEGLYDQVRAESAELRKAAVDADGNVKALGSDKYPKSGAVKTVLIRMKKGTPKAFCGIAFGSLAPYGAKLIAPRQGGPGFFIDYRKADCRPFMSFDRGRALVGKENGAVHSVELFSDGASDGLTDAEFFAKVRRTLSNRYKQEPQETAGTGAFPKLTYAVGDLEITLAADPNGGFTLKAVNTTLKALW